MRKLLNILIILVVAFAACNPNEDLYDELDDLKGDFNGIIENYTLIDDDYGIAVEAALIDALNETDTTYAELLESMLAFNSYFTAENYVGSILAERFPEYRKDSRAYVTYNYVVDLPEDLALYTSADEYEVTSDDYETVSFEVGVANYFHPDYPADFYLPEILDNSVSGASADDIYRIYYEYANENPVISEDLATNFTESFDDGLGQFKGFDIANPEKNWRPSSFGSSYYASMSGFGGGDVEDWLISDPIELDDDVSIAFNFTHEIKYLNHRWDQLAVAISNDFDGVNIETATWDTIDWGDVADTASLGSGYDPYNSGDLDISSYANSTIYIAFIYNSSAENAATWHILDVEVNPIKEYYPILHGKTPYVMSDYYQYTGTEWEKLEDVYCLNEDDYAAMGDPGDDNYFSADILPQDYLPNFLTAKYPTAGQGVEKIVVYDYNSELEGTITLATMYEYTSNGWESAYDYIGENTSQYVHNGLKWVFDPTVTLEMSGSDYQLIVDYVRDNIDGGLIDSYGTADYYTGASAYYGNFDLRVSVRVDNYPEAYGSLTEAEAMELIDESVQEGIVFMLQSKFPDAVPEVSGITVDYFITYDTYNNDYSRSNYTAHYRCTSAGTPPLFELQEVVEN